MTEREEDLRRGEFLRALHAGKANCSDWEINFIAGFLGDRALHKPDTDHIWFSPRKREVVDKMMKERSTR